MSKKYFLAFIAVVALFLATARARADEGWVIKSFVSGIKIQASGIVNVTETIQVDFGSLEKHGIYRDLPVNYKKADGSVHGTEISDFRVTVDEALARFELIDFGDYLRIKIGDASQTIHGPHSYQVSYSVKGVLVGYDGYDELYWNVTGNGWGVPMQSVLATVTLPQDIKIQASCYEGLQGVTALCDRHDLANGYAFASTRQLTSGEGLTVAVGYQKNIIPILAVKVKESFNPLRSVWALLAGFVTALAVGIYLIIRNWWRSGRDEYYQRKSLHDPEARETIMPIGAFETIVPEYDAPAKLTPAIISFIKEESANMTAISATVVDLATRGYLEITEIPKTGIFGSIDYELKKTGKSRDELLGFESLLYDGVFKARDSVKISQLKNTFYKKLPAIKKAIASQCVAEKYYVSDPSRARVKNSIWAILIAILGVVVAIWSGTLYGMTGQAVASVVCGLGIGTALAGIPALIVGIIGMPKRTAKGREMLRQIKGYELFINNVEKYRQQFFEREGTFMSVLPYAMIFGATDRLVKAFQVLGYTPAEPVWYHGGSPFNFKTFNSSFSSFTSKLSSSMASMPRSSGSGGGGFSGGGFGGGGGGSW